MNDSPHTLDVSSADITSGELAQLLDRERIRHLLQSFCEAVRIGAAIIDMKGEVFVGSIGSGSVRTFIGHIPRRWPLR